MSDDEDFIEPPIIYVGICVQSGTNRIQYYLPDGDAEVKQRAREIADMRTRELVDERQLRVLFNQDERPPVEWDEPSPDGLLAALAAAMPETARPLLDRPYADWPLHHRVEYACAMLAVEDLDEWPDDEVYSTCALMVTELLGHDTKTRALAMWSLHRLLDHRATWVQVELLDQMLGRGLEDVHLRVELSEALCTGKNRGADHLSILMRDRALLALLGVPAAQMPVEHVPTEMLVQAVLAGWPRIEPPAGASVVLLLSRRLVSADADERERVLAEVGYEANPHAYDGQSRHRLRMMAGIDELHAQFHAV